MRTCTVFLRQQSLLASQIKPERGHYLKYTSVVFREDFAVSVMKRSVLVRLIIKTRRRVQIDYALDHLDNEHLMKPLKGFKVSPAARVALWWRRRLTCEHGENNFREGPTICC